VLQLTAQLRTGRDGEKLTELNTAPIEMVQ
jgi:hypothetical protein